MEGQINQFSELKLIMMLLFTSYIILICLRYCILIIKLCTAELMQKDALLLTKGRRGGGMSMECLKLLYIGCPEKGTGYFQCPQRGYGSFPDDLMRCKVLLVNE